jgi:DNA-binding MurR/RpiR family transcriptional regulator
VSDDHLLEDLQARFADLSPQLRKAARFVIDNPEDVALHSMRTIAARASVHPNVMLRLARDAGFASYEPFRQHFQTWIVGRSSGDWKARAESLRQSPPGEVDAFVRDYIEQETANLRNTFSPEVATQLQAAAELIAEARGVYVLGLRSLFSASFYFNYVCRLFMSKTVLMTAIGGTFADELRDVTESDVLVAFSYQPYAQDTVRAVAFAREKGARTVVITDSKVSPVLGSDGVNIILSTAAKSLFPTLVPTVAAAQILAALLVSRGSDDTLREIERSETQLGRFGVYMR